MRDPKRIDKFLKEVGKYWKQVPDWRFGQFIMNIPFDRDLFYVEENQFLEYIKKMFDGIEKKQ